MKNYNWDYANEQKEEHAMTTWQQWIFIFFMLGVGLVIAILSIQGSR